MISEKVNDDMAYASEKWEQSKSNNQVMFSRQDVQSLLQMGKTELEHITESDGFTRQDVINLINSVPASGSQVQIHHLPLDTVKQLMGEYIYGKRKDEGLDCFYTVHELGKKYSCCPRSIYKYALINGWISKRAMTSLKLADYCKQIAMSEIEQRKPQIAVLGIRIAEEILQDIHDNYEKSNFEIKREYVNMYTKIVNALKKDISLPTEKINEVANKLESITNDIQANLDKSQPSASQLGDGPQVQEASFFVVDQIEDELPLPSKSLSKDPPSELSSPPLDTGPQ